MSVKRISTTSSSLFLTSELPVFVNRVTESFQLEQHRHEFVEINYVSEGSGFQYIEGQTIPVTKGDLFYLPLGASHVFRPSTPTPGRSKLIVYNCVFSESFAAQLGEAYRLDDDTLRVLASSYPEQPWLHVHDREGALQRSFNSMHEEYRRKSLNFVAMLQVEIVRILVYMGRRLPVGDEQASGGRSDYLRPLGSQLFTDEAIDASVNLIRQQLHGSAVQLSALAAGAGLSERQFRRRFTERTGMTFTDFVHKSRIEASCELLLSTGDKVAAIARQMGYQDIKFFNSLFKKKTGMTPGQYRSSRLI